jgi:hypothetical protein
MPHFNNVRLCLTPDLVVNTVVTFVILLAVRSMDVSHLPLPFFPAGSIKLKKHNATTNGPGRQLG